MDQGDCPLFLVDPDAEVGPAFRRQVGEFDITQLRRVAVFAHGLKGRGRIIQLKRVTVGRLLLEGIDVERNPEFQGAAPRQVELDVRQPRQFDIASGRTGPRGKESPVGITPAFLIQRARSPRPCALPLSRSNKDLPSSLHSDE